MTRSPTSVSMVPSYGFFSPGPLKIFHHFTLTERPMHPTPKITDLEKYDMRKLGWLWAKTAVDF